MTTKTIVDYILQGGIKGRKFQPSESSARLFEKGCSYYEVTGMGVCRDSSVTLTVRTNQGIESEFWLNLLVHDKEYAQPQPSRTEPNYVLKDVRRALSNSEKTHNPYSGHLTSSQLKRLATICDTGKRARIAKSFRSFRTN